MNTSLEHHLIGDLLVSLINQIPKIDRFDEELTDMIHLLSDLTKKPDQPGRGTAHRITHAHEVDRETRLAVGRSVGCYRYTTGQTVWTREETSPRRCERSRVRDTCNSGCDLNHFY